MKKKIRIFGGLFIFDFRKMAKDLCVYIPSFILWSKCSMYASMNLSFWKEVWLFFIVVISIDLIRWGLSKD